MTSRLRLVVAQRGIGHLGDVGRDILNALVTGTRDVEILAELARVRMRTNSA